MLQLFDSSLTGIPAQRSMPPVMMAVCCASNSVYEMVLDPSMDKPIISGEFKSQPILQVMKACQAGYLKDFLDSVLAKPSLYAGKQWKLSEIFATWLLHGAPSVIK